MPSTTQQRSLAELDILSVDDKVKENAFFIMTQGLSGIAKVRISAVQRLMQLRKESAVEEARFQASLPTRPKGAEWKIRPVVAET